VPSGLLRRAMRGALGETPVRRVGIGTAGLALVVSGLFGGLRAVGGPEVPVLAPGTSDGGQPWAVSVIKARLASDLPGLALQNKADSWLVVVATVEVTSDESRNDMREILRLSGVPGLLDEVPAYVALARDGTLVGYLNPGMPERVGFFWEHAVGSPLPKLLDVQIYGKTQRKDSLNGHLDWLDPAKQAIVRVPIEDVR